MRKTVCYFGSFYPDYARNHVLIEGLKRNSCEVIICNDRQVGLKHYLNLLKIFFRTAFSAETIIVGAVCYHDVPLAWILAKIFRKKLIFDAFISLYDTYTSDRRLFAPKSIRAKKVYLWDYISCHLADLVIVDTKAHAKYFIEKFHLRKERVKYLYIGADNHFFWPVKKKLGRKFVVEFHGSFQPLQGVEFIIRAANLLKSEKDVMFIIAGDGQNKKEVVELALKLKLENIQFLPFLSLEQVRDLISNANVCLGIFGSSDKANRVIPNKAYEAMAMRKPLITMDSIAARELFNNGKNALLIPNKDPQVLTNAIIRLKNDQSRINLIAENGYRLFLDKAIPEVLGKQLKKLCNKI